MKNYEIANINNALSSLVDQKLTGRLKFKLFKAKRACEQALELVHQTMEGVDSEADRLEILNEEQELKLDKFTLDELESLPLSMKDLGNLASIIDFGEELEEEV